MLQQCVDADGSDKQKCEPWHGDFALAAVVLSPRQEEAHNHKHRGEQHHAYHLGYCRRTRDAEGVGRVHGIARTCHVCHFVERAAGVDCHRAVGEPVEQSGAIHYRVDEHRQGAEHHYGRHGYRRLMAFAAHHRLCAEHGCGSADCAACRCEQGGVAVQFNPSAEEESEQQCAGNDDYVDGYCRQSHGRYVAERQTETIKDDAEAQQPLGAELYAGLPLLRHAAAQRVGINHTYDYAHDQRAKRQGLDFGNAGDVECRQRHQRYQRDAVQAVECCGLHY